MFSHWVWLSITGGDMHQTTDTHKQRGRNQWGTVDDHLAVFLTWHRGWRGKHGGLVWARLLPHLLRTVPGNSSHNHPSTEQLCSHQSNELDFGFCAGALRLRRRGIHLHGERCAWTGAYPGGFGLRVGVLFSRVSLKAIRGWKCDFLLVCNHTTSAVNFRGMLSSERRRLTVQIARRGAPHRNAGTPSRRSSPCSAGLYWGVPGTAAVWFWSQCTQLPVEGERWTEVTQTADVPLCQPLDDLWINLHVILGRIKEAEAERQLISVPGCTLFNSLWSANPRGSSNPRARRGGWTDAWCRRDSASCLPGSEIAGC